MIYKFTRVNFLLLSDFNRSYDVIILVVEFLLSVHGYEVAILGDDTGSLLVTGLLLHAVHFVKRFTNDSDKHVQHDDVGQQQTETPNNPESDWLNSVIESVSVTISNGQSVSIDPAHGIILNK